jgi:hypothetical protein
LPADIFGILSTSRVPAVILSAFKFGMHAAAIVLLPVMVAFLNVADPS